MTKIVVVGDVHGKTQQYQKMLRQKYEGVRTIQIGDMGIGFKHVGLHKMGDNHKWFRGNHDNPEKCLQNPNYLGDYGFLEADSLFWLAGAFSIDRIWRTPGVTWWPGEELSTSELQKAFDLYLEVKPRFVVSHEAPTEAAKNMLHGLLGDYFAAKADCTMSRTAEALQVMFDTHKPEQWVFGHYHVDKSFDWRGTKFTCVAELSTYELETE
jgi:Calcineurin-like phosphoesterase